MKKQIILNVALCPSRVVVSGFHPHGHPGVDEYNQ